MEMRFGPVWESIADAVPDGTAIVQGEVRRSWRDFEARAARLAGALERLGVGRDARIAQYLYNGPEYLETCFAAFKLGAVPINVNYRYLEDELVYLVDNADAEALVFHTSLGERVEKVRARLPRVRAWIAVDDGGAAAASALDYEDVIATGAPAPRRPLPAGGLYMLYTGGTTGMPKGVMYDESAFCAGMMLGYPLHGGAAPTRADDVAAAARGLHAKGGAPTCVVGPPLMHGTGLWVGGFVTLNQGGTVALLSSRAFDPHELWQLVERERATDVVIVGDAFAKPMVRALEESEARGRRYDLSSLRLVASSGVMWTTPVKQALLQRADCALLDIMGSTEGGMAQSLTTRATTAETARFQLNPTAKVFTDDDREVAPGSGERGMIATTGNVPLGYYKDPDKSARTFRTIGGVRYSFPGDYATVEADGRITLLGRGSVCINTGGEKVFPEEVEEVVKLHPAVYDCLVVGVPDERFGEAVTAVASLRPGATTTPEEILAIARGKLSHFKLPKRILLVDAVQRAANGKADYKWAKEHAVASGPAK